MEFLYYPGCSLEGTAKEYNLSTQAVMHCIGHTLLELPEWTCCGASAAESQNALLALVMPAHNLAIAEKCNADKPDRPVMVPCSACYLNLKRANEISRKAPDLLSTVNMVIDHKELVFTGKSTIKHLLEVFSKDLGADRMSEFIKNRFKGLVVAPYYGCQCIRPYTIFDDGEQPHSMDALIRITGAEVLKWNMGAKCCGASHMNTKPDLGIKLVTQILKSAREADVILTVCPMCQMNLEGFQSKISRIEHQDLHKPVLYLPQFIGLSMGLSPKNLGIDLNLSVPKNSLFNIPSG